MSFSSCESTTSIAKLEVFVSKTKGLERFAWIKVGQVWKNISKLERHSLVQISQNVTSPFTTTCDLKLFATRFGNIVTTRPNFNYFGHSHNYDATIRKFYPIGWIDFTFIFIH